MEDTLNYFKTASFEELRDLNILSTKIGEAGLYFEDRKSPEDHTKSLYGDDVKYMLPFSNDKKGLWQTPIQIASYLIFLSNKNIKTFFEIGTFSGYTSMIISSYLSRFGLEKFDAFDVNPFLSPETMEMIKKFNLPINYILTNGDPENVKRFILQNYDIIFIDGDHSYEGVSADFKNYSQMGRYISFHDINDYFCKGVVDFWNKLKIDYKDTANFYEFIDHPNNFHLMGFGILEWKK